jgi:hypothetical protein
MTSHYENGIVNTTPYVTHGNDTQPSPSKNVSFCEDFMGNLDIIAGTPVAYTRTVVQAGAGSATFTSANGKGGLVLLTNDDADDDSISIQSKSEFFTFSSTKAWSMSYRVKVSDATQSDFMVGVAITDTSPLDATDYIAFIKADGSTTCSLKLTKNSTSTTVGSTTLADDTFVILGARYNPNKVGVGAVVEMFVNDVMVASTTTLTNVPDDEDLAFTIHIQNGEAVAKTCTIDYANVIQER